MSKKLCKAKVQLQYPCRWQYKVITIDHQRDSERIVAMLQDCWCDISPSNSSRTGRYTCLNVEVEVGSEQQRDALFQALKDLETVKVVL